jgi:hypothetical protein
MDNTTILTILAAIFFGSVFVVYIMWFWYFVVHDRCNICDIV